jgi:uncharacterized protein with PIN domain
MTAPLSPQRFIADVMVGRLARWLRILGYDVSYSNQYDDDEIAALARSEGRIILTRDAGLGERHPSEGLIFIEDDTLDEQILQLIRERQLQPVGLFTRCLECNRVLDSVERASIVDRVPPYVYETQSRFRSCPECGRVYWPGTHGDDVRQRIARWIPSSGDFEIEP